jgi:hypothetical protein
LAFDGDFGHAPWAFVVLAVFNIRQQGKPAALASVASEFELKHMASLPKKGAS